MLATQDVLFGKLAIGRRYLQRADALRLVGARSGSESLSETALRLGLLERARVDELLGVLEHGTLICRGPCGRSYRLSEMQPQETVACAQCGGALFVARGAPALPEPVLVPAPARAQLPEPVLVPAQPAEEPAPDPAAAARAEAEAARAREEAAQELAEGTFANLELGLDDSGPPPSDFALEFSAGVPELGGEGTLELDDPLSYTGPEGGGFPAPIAPSPDPLPPAAQPPPTAPSFTPFQVTPHLRVLAPIGQGGMGAVYRGETTDGRVLAVKILSGAAEMTGEVMARFRREVQLTSGMSHPGIVRVHGAGLVAEGSDNAGRPYYAMDFVRGRDLNDWAAETQRSPQACVRLVLQICDAMGYAHARGVIHRDLKPANVLVTHEGEVPMVCDFGLARYKSEQQSLTRTGDILGTPSFMPPEQALGNRKKIGPPTDTYAIGAILYSLLTLRPPFEGKSSFAVIRKVVKETVKPPASLNPAVSPELEAVVLKSLEKEPVDRYHTCEQLQAALQPFV